MKTLIRLPLALSAIASVFLCGCASTPEEELFPVSITIQELEDRMDKALDPEGRYAKAKSYVQRQHVSTYRFIEDAIETLNEVRFLAPDKLKITTFDGVAPVLSIIINGDNGWIVDYNTKRLTRIEDDRVKEIRLFTMVANPGTRRSSVFDEITVEGCRIGDEEFLKLSCRFRNPPKGSKTNGMDIYIDPATYLIRRQKIGTSMSEIRDYGLRDGVMIPVEIHTVDGRVRSSTRVTEYVLNPKLEITEFYPPPF